MIETLPAKVIIYRCQFFRKVSNILPNMVKSKIKIFPEKPVFNCSQSRINGPDRLYGNV